MALAQSERPAEAKEAFEQALALSPDNPAVLTNLGLFHAQRGDTGQAEALMRKAAARPDASAQERQNLALVLGLQGKLGEAEPLIRHDLPPEVATANLAYLNADAAGAREAVRAAPAATATAEPSSRSWTTLKDAQAPDR